MRAVNVGGATGVPSCPAVDATKVRCSRIRAAVGRNASISPARLLPVASPVARCIAGPVSGPHRGSGLAGCAETAQSGQGARRSGKLPTSPPAQRRGCRVGCDRLIESCTLCELRQRGPAMEGRVTDTAKRYTGYLTTFVECIRVCTRSAPAPARLQRRRSTNSAPNVPR